MLLVRVILSVLTAWALLITLMLGLLLILKSLERIRSHLQKIAMGVRAIETQTTPLGAHAGALVTSLNEANDSVGDAALRLSEVANDLDTAEPALRSRRSQGGTR